MIVHEVLEKLIMKVEKNQTRSIFNQEENHYVDMDLKNPIKKIRL